MTLFGKTIITIIVVGIIGVGGYMYATRPIAAPSANTDMDSTAFQATSTDTTNNGDNASSTATSSVGSVASFKIAAGTKAEFNINEILRGKSFTVVGTTADVSGGVQVDMMKPEDSVIGTIKINARTFKTDSSNRDNAIARFVLKSEEVSNEFITFEAKEIGGLSIDAAENVAKGETISFKVKGDLTIAGITKRTTFDATFATAANGQIKGVAEAKIKRSDFKLVIPSVPFVASVEDEFLIKIDAVLEK